VSVAVPTQGEQVLVPTQKPATCSSVWGCSSSEAFTSPETHPLSIAGMVIGVTLCLGAGVAIGRQIIVKRRIGQMFK
jgi:hypothetical protein